MENSIVELLAKLGHHPVRKSGKEHIYHSMLRDDDHTPSFTVDDDLGVWYDHGTGKGGGILNWPYCSDRKSLPGEPVRTLP